MNISMVSVDYQHAAIAQRELFSFTPMSLKNALEQVKKQYPHLGCILLATCNRTELWLSGRRNEDPSAAELLCQLKELTYETVQDLFIQRQQKPAVEHLFTLACGLRSRILLEDQILTQVREALELAREIQCIDTALDRLFQMAVTAAKRVKTEVNFNRANPSAATKALELLKTKMVNLQKCSCLIIGNGVMGRLMAQLLVQAGCQVAVTLRTYRHGETLVPAGCQAIAYEERVRRLTDYDIIVSATTSPHYTLRFADVRTVWDGQKRMIIDLAVPRDIQPEITNLPGVQLYDIDHLGEGQLQLPEEVSTKVAERIKEGMKEYEHWYYFRDFITEINNIREAAVIDMLTRTERTVNRLILDEEQRSQLRKTFSHAADMVIGKILFGLRDSLDQTMWGACLDALEEAALKSPGWDKNNRSGT